MEVVAEKSIWSRFLKLGCCSSDLIKNFWSGREEAIKVDRKKGQRGMNRAE